MGGSWDRWDRWRRCPWTSGSARAARTRACTRWRPSKTRRRWPARIDPQTRRRTGGKCVHYRVGGCAVGREGHDTWEPADQLQGSHVKGLINAYNEKLRNVSKS